MNTYFRSAAAIVAAVAAILALTSVAGAQIINQRTNALAGEITVNVTKTKKVKKVALLDLRFICPDNVRRINSPRISGIGSANVSKKGYFTLKKSNVKVVHPDTGKKLGTGSFEIKGRLVGKKLVGTYTVKSKGCNVNKNVKLDSGA